jgi:hypothetical protein
MLLLSSPAPRRYLEPSAIASSHLTDLTTMFFLTLVVPVDLQFFGAI